MRKKIDLLALKESNGSYRLSRRISSLRRYASNSSIFVEVVVKGESLRNAEPVHNGEADTINETKRVIGILAENAQSPGLVLLSNIFQQGRLLPEQRTCDSHRKPVTAGCLVPHPN